MTRAVPTVGTDLTGRQLRTVTVLAQQQAMQVDTLADYLDTGLNHVYEILAQLRDIGLVEPELIRVGGAPGGKWVVPSQDTVQWYYGRRLRRWTPPRLWSVHGRAVNQTRIALGARERRTWRSSREIRMDHPDRIHPADGEWTAPTGRKVTVTVDARGYRVTPGKLSERLQHLMHHAVIDQCTAILWVCAGTTTPEAVRRAAAALPNRRGAQPDRPTIAVHRLVDLADSYAPSNAPRGAV